MKAKKKAKAKTSKKTSTSSASKKAKKTSGTDIIELILQDHKSLKRLIKVMKNSDKSLEERQDAFSEFAPLLLAHAKPEEETLYVFMKGDDELREEGLEGDVEHQLADQLVEEIQATEDEDLWSARVKVLAELVEHHIEEEEEDMLPDFKKHCESADREFLGKEFLMLKKRLESADEDYSSSSREVHATH